MLEPISDKPDPRATNVWFLMLPQFHMLDLSGPIQVFYEASEYGAKYRLHYVADEKSVRSTAGRLGDAIGDAAVFKMKLRQEIKAVLTPEQVERFKGLCALEHGKKGHRKAHGDSRHTVEVE